MLTGDLHYLSPSTLTLIAGNGADADVSAEYARSASRTAPDRIVRWSCTNGDRRDVRHFLAGHDITAEVEARHLRAERAAARRELAELQRPYEALGTRVQIRPADAGRVWLYLGGVARAYEPGEIRAREGLSAKANAAFADMQRRAARIVALVAQLGR